MIILRVRLEWVYYYYIVNKKRKKTSVGQIAQHDEVGVNIEFGNQNGYDTNNTIKNAKCIININLQKISMFNIDIKIIKQLLL